MVVIKGPLHSNEASGALAGAVIFSKQGGRSYAKKYARPKNPKSRRQRGIRAMIKFLTQNWTNISPGDKATWLELAKRDSISRQNAYIAYNMKRWKDYRFPSLAYPATESGWDANLTFQTLSGSKGHVKIELKWMMGKGSLYGYAILRDTAEIVVPNWNFCTGVILSLGGDSVPDLFIDRQLDAGTYHYRTATFTDSGKFLKCLPDDTAVAT